MTKHSITIRVGTNPVRPHVVFTAKGQPSLTFDPPRQPEPVTDNSSHYGVSGLSASEDLPWEAQD